MNTISTSSHQPWNKGKLVGQKAPLRLKDIWAIRVRFQIAEDTRDLALFDLALNRPVVARPVASLGLMLEAQSLPVPAYCRWTVASCRSLKSHY